MLSDPIRVTLLVTQALEQLRVPYLVGGSLASAVHGVVRATMGADIVADLKPEHADPLTKLLADKFYIDCQMIVEGQDRAMYVTTAEDIILAKLEWYKQGGEISERQWRDVLGVMGVRGDELDLDYLRRWAQQLEIAELLQRALHEGGLI